MVDAKVVNSHNMKTRYLVLERVKSKGCKIPTTAVAPLRSSRSNPTELLVELWL